jgi:hypothetical protein
MVVFKKCHKTFSQNKNVRRKDEGNVASPSWGENVLEYSNMDDGVNALEPFLSLVSMSNKK